MNDELRPCPFCGSEAYTRDAITYPNGERSPAFVQCVNRCAIRSGYDLREVIERWNLRRPEDALRAELEQVKAERDVQSEIIEDDQTLLADLRSAASGMLDYDDTDPAVWQARIEYLLSMMGVQDGNDSDANADAE